MQHAWEAGSQVINLQQKTHRQLSLARQLPIPHPAQGSSRVHLVKMQMLDLCTNFLGKGLLLYSFLVLIKPKANKYCSAPDTQEPISAGQGG